MATCISKCKTCEPRDWPILFVASSRRVKLDLRNLGPKPFCLHASGLKVDLGSCAYVGDDFHVDARGSATAGLIGIWLDREAD